MIIIFSLSLVHVVTVSKLNDVPNFYEVSSPCLFHGEEAS
jgi:hypothetical protein